jgi:hypothetical protein
MAAMNGTIGHLRFPAGFGSASQRRTNTSHSACRDTRFTHFAKDRP